MLQQSAIIESFQPITPERIRASILASVHRPALPRNKPQDIDIGIEHEFFLVDANNEPALHEESQLLFEAMITEGRWVLDTATDDSLGPMIWSIRCISGLGWGTILKYDHHPHLLEVATPPHKSAATIEALFSQVLSDIGSTAERNGLRISDRPILMIAADDPRILSPLAMFRQLRTYRSALYERRGQQPTAHTNYAATIAATQTHVGVDWWEMQSLIERLYQQEGLHSEFAYRCFGDDAEMLRIARWRGYLDVFQDSPLAEYPKIAPWTIDAWATALLDTPLAGLANPKWGAQTMREIAMASDAELSSMLIDVRDLQLIKPRLYGTIEFRGDPAQDTPQNIAALAEHRRRSIVNVLLEESTL